MTDDRGPPLSTCRRGTLSRTPTNGTIGCRQLFTATAVGQHKGRPLPSRGEGRPKA